MRFLVDADLPRPVAALVRSLGHEAGMYATSAWVRHRMTRSLDMRKPTGYVCSPAISILRTFVTILRKTTRGWPY
jgi:hypothetical protein